MKENCSALRGSLTKETLFKMHPINYLKQVPQGHSRHLRPIKRLTTDRPSRRWLAIQQGYDLDKPSRQFLESEKFLQIRFSCQLVADLSLSKKGLRMKVLYSEFVLELSVKDSATEAEEIQDALHNF